MRSTVTHSASKLPADVPTDDEVRALIAACSRRAPTGIRNAALLAVLRGCGLRIAEALALRAADVDLDGATLHVRHGKGGKSRRLGVDPATLGLLARWMDRRKALGLNGRQPVFCKLDGGVVDQSYVRHLLPRLAAKAGIERRIHAHGLRHAFAAGLARQGVPLNVIRDALGHSSVAVTDRYLRDVAPVLVERVMQASTWADPV